MNPDVLTQRAIPPLPARGPLGMVLPRAAGQSAAGFSEIASAYRRHGGFMTGDEVLHRMRATFPQPISALARLIVSRHVVCVAWQSLVFLPTFQFDLATMSLREGPRRALLELDGVFDDWELARWFVQPNDWLQGAAPIERIESDLTAVLQAARADRFIARG
jgi:hypothetical protein